MRRESPTAALRRLGFTDPARAQRLTEGRDFAAVLDALGESPDPDQGLLAMLRMADGAPEAFQRITATPRLLSAVSQLCGMSTALGDILITHPDWIDGLGAEPTINPDAFLTIGQHADTPWDTGVTRLREEYYRQLLSIAAWDLMADHPLERFDTVAALLSDLVSAALSGAHALARATIPGSDTVRLAIIAMGKTGARELNYISDVDVIYVAEPAGDDEAAALDTATKIVTALTKAVSAPGSAPALWPLDANLRPEGQDGPLVRTLASHVAYYERWAKDWEFQALLKARAVAGDPDLGAAYVDAIQPFIWSASGRDQFVETTRHMRGRVESTIASRDAARQIKLGAGGLRDVEFTVQLLQLVHGRVDPSLRVRSTLDALAALRDNGYVARVDADRLEQHYRFLRTLEHRIQLQKMRRSQVLPEDDGQLRRIARAMKMPGITTGEELESAWRDVRAEVRSLHQAIYYRPLLPEAARLSDDDISLDRDAAADRLAGIGYRDPTRAVGHIAALTEGVSRTAMIQRQLLPVLLGWFAEGPEPDSGLLHFRILSETMGRTHWYMKLLRDSSMAGHRLAHILSTSRYLAEEIPKLPESVRWLEGDSELEPRSIGALRSELDALISRRTTPEGIAMAGRYLRRRSLLRTGLGLVLGLIDTERAQDSITNGAEIAVQAALQAATKKILAEFNLDEAPSSYLIVGMGSFGAREMSYGSDCDLLFVHQPHGDEELAQRVAVSIASAVMAMLSEGTEEPALRSDADLRPEGRNGPLARTLDAYGEYYRRWAETWERQSLLKARPIAGDAELGRQFIALIDPVRYGQGLTDAEDRDVRRMKARVETERAPRGASKARHLKLGPGGISDVEWTVQYLQLRYAGQQSTLQTTSTMTGLDAAMSAGLLSEDDGVRLAEAWLYAQQLRFAIALGTGRTSGPRLDVVPTDSTELANIAALLSHDLTARHEVEEIYLRLARRARAVVERIFFENER
ncbi:bifunctional [glutamine synthetase] adenylyltransferase/[glutamine synthetase]-adenylyl-L-tyrosine phosphorylase [Flaviflexus equikiangi]|uniref:Bifunctional [glutamine synthetase] adenylyltransferase/[glutamine synthetase]-adenylyl-L-tyrosine phosphorylase n=1 Tax=Flaviflexus equikiangi TaxID=2758573 RepID=A0ABS2TEZ9_9ACTO|nr:bifunctional [glutamine synthetase] adenylyltransferase/[glutamine synthetase]-adenylyl-L-tyrosine phosphorylase [Flaviflexus equikiangi]MBM9433234.1 bifunctional [glutamine synthetase] adenylyltransferase/[glutamine synthetase]-adenylyl-L-tyrosine phosphorylase [Flaviflexus equikiangi]